MEIMLAKFVKDISVEFEVLTTVVMKSSIYWDITPCSPLEANMPPPSSGSKIKRNRNPTRNQSSACRLFSRWYLAPLIIQM
jgi:hypothetical protein